MTITLETRRGTVRFDSDLSAHDVAAKLAGVKGDFAADLRRSFARGWSPRQEQWARLLVHEAENPAEAPKDIPDLSGIVALFDKAARSLKYPKLTFYRDGDRKVVLARCGQSSRTPGDVRVTDGRGYGVGQYFGAISRSGTTSVRDAEVLEIIRGMSSDPVRYAAEHGHRTGSCCFCSRLLTDARSTSVGYGPVCAENYGLPWGEGAETPELVPVNSETSTEFD